MIDRLRHAASAWPRPGRALMMALLLVILPGVPHAFSERPFELEHGPPELAEVVELIESGHWGEAVTRGREVLARTETEYGPESLATALVLDRLVESLWRSGQAGDDSIRPLAERALAIEERELGPDHPEVATCLQIFGNLLARRGEFAESRALHERALRIREAHYGPVDENVAAALNDLGIVVGRSGDVTSALEIHLRALAIREEVHPPGHFQIAMSHANIGWAMVAVGDFDGVLDHSAKALEIVEAKEGPSHPMVLGLRANMAVAALYLGEYRTAHAEFSELLEIRTEMLGPEHLDVAQSIHNLAACEEVQGDYAAARSHAEEAGRIIRSTLGPDHYELFHPVRMVGDADQKLGNLDRAAGAYAEALRIAEVAKGPESGDAAIALRALAGVDLARGRVDDARTALDRALAIAEAQVHTDPTVLASVLQEYRDLELAAGNLDVALGMARRAYARYDQSGGATVFAPSALHGVARIEIELGMTDSARVHLGQAIAGFESLFGVEHPNVARALLDLAGLERGDDPARALELALRAEKIGREHQRLLTRALPEADAIDFATVRASGRDLALSLALEPVVRDEPELVARVHDTVIRSRAVVLDEVAARHRQARLSQDPELATLRARERQARSRLANLVLRAEKDVDPAHHRRLLDDARRMRDEAEAALAAARAAGPGATGDDAGLADVQHALERGQTLVSYVRFTRSSSDGTAVDGYGAFVAGGAGAPSLHWLGAADEIDEAVLAWRREAERNPGADPEARATAAAAAEARGLELTALVWSPLVPTLEGAEAVLVVPDGSLHLTSLMALPIAPGRYLVEEPFLVHVASAERDLLPTGLTPSSGLVAFGAPDYDADCAALSADLALDDLSPGELLAGAGPSFRGVSPGCQEFRAVRFPPLPDSGREATEVVRLWTERSGPGTASLVLGDAANEAAFKALASGHRVLHLATHGFFVSEACVVLPEHGDDRRGVGGLTPSGPSIPGRSVPSNPLVRSGLVLAGANTRPETAADAEDGLLTAEEISALDLDGVEWAVLSACETGLGELHDAEGVLGLRRAFQVAGARTVVMSLWPVSDDAARAWMGHLYAARLEAGESTAGSVRAAARAMLAEQRARGLGDHPHDWAGFLAAGDWR